MFCRKKNCLMTQKQYEAELNRLSSTRRLLNKFRYDSNIRYTKSEIWRALKKGQTVCYLEYPKATEEEVKDIIARLKYLGYNVERCFFGIRVRLDDNEKGIDYVSY